MIEHQARMGDVLRQRADGHGWRIVNETPLPLVCFTRGASRPGRLSRRAAPAADRLDVGSPYRRRPGLRACITNFRTTEAKIHQIVEEMNQLFQEGVVALEPEPQLR